MSNGKRGKRRPYTPKHSASGSVLLDTIMSSSREDIQPQDLDLVITPAFAQLVSMEDYGTITIEGFVLLNEANCLVYCLARLIFEGARCDDVVKVQLHGICQDAVDKAEAASEALADMAERFKQVNELRATPEQMSVIKDAIHVMPKLTPLANRGTFFKSMKDAQRMVDQAVGAPSGKSAA